MVLATVYQSVGTMSEGRPEGMVAIAFWIWVSSPWQNFTTMVFGLEWLASVIRSWNSLRYSSTVSWSVLSHVLSQEQSKVGSDGVSDDGRLTIVQCHHYHWPPSSDLYRSSIRILLLFWYHQPNLHSYHCHYQPAPCAIYHSTTTAPPCSTHIPCSRPITSRMHQFSRSWVAVTTRTCEDLRWHPSAPSGIRVSSYYVHSTTICSSR